MTARENLFYGLGIIAYATARADGNIQAAEKNELRSIIEQWAKRYEPDYDISEIIFRILADHKPRLDDGFDLGMKYLKLGAEAFDEKLKERFIYLIHDVAHAFPGVTLDEKQVVEKFTKAIKSH